MTLFLQAMILGASGCLSIFAVSPAVRGIFYLVDKGQKETNGKISIANVTALRGGLWIGRLERFAIFCSIVSNWPEGIALALAIKGLGRYAELKSADQATAERFIIGTFVSLTLAALIGVAARALAEHVATA